MKYLIIVVLFLMGCTKEEPMEVFPSQEQIVALAKRYNGVCFKRFEGLGILKQDGSWGDSKTGLTVCHIGESCDRKNAKRCVTTEICSQWMRADLVEHNFNTGAFKLVRCP